MASGGTEVAMARRVLLGGTSGERPSSPRYESRPHVLEVGGAPVRRCTDGWMVITCRGTASGTPAMEYASEVNATSGNWIPRT